jgi:hypothetical protein
MNFPTYTTATSDTSMIVFYGDFAKAYESEEEIKARLAIAAEECRRLFVSTRVKVKRFIWKFPFVPVAAFSLPKIITRQHKTKQEKVLQMRYA